MIFEDLNEDWDIDFTDIYQNWINWISVMEMDGTDLFNILVKKLNYCLQAFGQNVIFVFLLYYLILRPQLPFSCIQQGF